MRIKKHPSGNEYVRSGGVWVRNPCKTGLRPLQLTPMFAPGDKSTVLLNERLNRTHPKISDEAISFGKAVIVSDGHDFAARHVLAAELPPDVAVFAVNGAAAGWTLTSPDRRRAINAFVVNNPYKECMRQMPPKGHKYFPTCVASDRSDHEFLRKYPGRVYTYSPTPEDSFGTPEPQSYYIDDYRSPVLAAVALAHRFGVRKMLLLCCDQSFAENRDGSVRLENGLFTYPQHLKSHAIADAAFWWMSQGDEPVEVADFSSGPKYTNTQYISGTEEALAFFRDQEEGTLT